jgi:membrane-associated phospholipid phosphatase
MDYRTYHSVNTFFASHAWLAHVFSGLETVLPVLLGLAAFALWLFDRPTGGHKWKLASASALAAGALGLIVNRIVAAVWDRPRPYETHPAAHVWGGRSHDPSFPSDHASAAFGIAVAVFLFDRIVGSFFLAAAVLISAGRVFVGAHYPADVLAGCAIGTGCAFLVVRLARPFLSACVRLVERLTDPLVAPAWRLFGRR